MKLNTYFLKNALVIAAMVSLVSPLMGQRSGLSQNQSLQQNFESPPRQSYPETWFHLIGGNVNKDALTKDLEAVRRSGISGIQLFHGKGRPWPGVEPQIQTLSPTWDSLISRVTEETQRLGLNFTMQNCPGWAMSGGPWITPDRAMRHLIFSRQNISGGELIECDLKLPEPSVESWRDYRDIAVVAFPTPAGDDGAWLKPANVRSFPRDNAWSDWLAGKEVKIQIPSEDTPAWVEFDFEKPITLRSIELPPIEHLMKRISFDPDCEIAVSVPDQDSWTELIRHTVPRGNWQDRQPEVPWVISVADARSSRYRIVFHNNRPMEITQLRLSSAARLQDWRAQAGYALRSLERSPNALQSADAWIAKESVVDLTQYMDAEGRLNWDAPEGQWTVVRFGHVNTGVKNKPAPPEATGFECDKLSDAGAEQHFAGYIGRLTKPGGAADGGRLKGMLIDSWECYTQTWTAAMEKEFQSRRGYALRTWLPALAGWVVEDHQTSERFLRDWRATISDLIVEKYYGRLAALGRARGLTLSFETSVGDVSPGDILEYFKFADIPMCEVWQPNDPHDGGLETKPIAATASAAHIYGKPRVAAESFTSVPLDWREHPFALKNVADRSFALGVTHPVFHTYTHNPLDRVPGTSFGGRIGTPFLRGQTWWQHMPHFNQYLARCSFMLEQGNPVADVLWYLGDDLDHKPRQDSPFPTGYHFDYLNSDALQTRLSVDQGHLVIPEGTRWGVLWLPRDQCRRLTPKTLAKIKELLHAGATVIGEAPGLNASLSGGVESDRKFKSLVAELWGELPPETGDRQIGQGRLMWGGDLNDSLARLAIEPDLRGILPARWCHRRTENADIYFVIGHRTKPLNANLHFRAKGTPMFCSPIDGNTTPVALYQATATGTSIPIQLPVAGSVFVVFENESSKPKWQSIEHDGQVLVDATDSDRVDKSAALPAFGLSRKKSIQPWIEPTPLSFEVLDGGRSLLAWKNGPYTLKRSDGEPLTLNVAGAKTVSLNRGWRLSFPSGWGAPESIDLANVQPWSELEDKAARHFSGTVTYQTTFTLDQLKADERLMLDLGRVGNIAKIKLNGKDSSVLWAAPYRKDITGEIKSGENVLSIEVTNTWHNRLSYDASLPKHQRKTWTYAAPKANSPLEFSGLGAEVQLHIGKLMALPNP